MVARTLNVMAGPRPGHPSPHVPRQITGAGPGDDVDRLARPRIRLAAGSYVSAHEGEPGHDLEKTTNRHDENRRIAAGSPLNSTG
jgi:hypothetical protein